MKCEPLSRETPRTATMIVRVMTPVGISRVTLADGASLADLQAEIEAHCKVSLKKKTGPHKVLKGFW